MRNIFRSAFVSFRSNTRINCICMTAFCYHAGIQPARGSLSFAVLLSPHPLGYQVYNIVLTPLFHYQQNRERIFASQGKQLIKHHVLQLNAIASPLIIPYYTKYIVFLFILVVVAFVFSFLADFERLKPPLQLQLTQIIISHHPNAEFSLLYCPMKNEVDKNQTVP